MERDVKGAVFAFSEVGVLLYSNRDFLIEDIRNDTKKYALDLSDIFEGISASEVISGQNSFFLKWKQGQQGDAFQSAVVKVEANVIIQQDSSQRVIFIQINRVLDILQCGYSYEDDLNILNDIIDSFSIPTWCIEFLEPVDISVSDREIIRQVFQNDSCWRLCNKAFARLYGLPADMDFNKQPVSSFFPRSPENEQFIHEVITNEFAVDNALSIDTNHDGSAIYIENFVRAHIENGKLLRLWGTSRDITREKRTENYLIHRETEIREVLSSIPDVILVVNRQGVLQGANPAFESQFGWDVDAWLGKDVNEIIGLKKYLRGKSRLKVDQQIRFAAEVSLPDLSKCKFDISLSGFLDEMDEERFVGVFRPVPVSTK